MNTAMGGPDTLPFDLRNKRVSTYCAYNGGQDTEERRRLQKTLEDALGATLCVRGTQVDDSTKALSVIRAEASRMAEHGAELNAGLHHGNAEHFLPLRFRPAQIKAMVPDVVHLVEADPVLKSAVTSPRATAAWADAETGELLRRGGSARRLIPLVQNATHDATMVVRAIDDVYKHR